MIYLNIINVNAVLYIDIVFPLPCDQKADGSRGRSLAKDLEDLCQKRGHL